MAAQTAGMSVQSYLDWDQKLHLCEGSLDATVSVFDFLILRLDTWILCWKIIHFLYFIEFRIFALYISLNSEYLSFKFG